MHLQERIQEQLGNIEYRYEATSENEVYTVEPADVATVISEVANHIKEGWMSPFVTIAVVPVWIGEREEAYAEVWVREDDEDYE